MRIKEGKHGRAVTAVYPGMSSNKRNQVRLNRITGLLLVLFAVLQSCAGEREKPETHSVTDEQADSLASEIEDGVSTELADGLELSLWASEALLEDPVALDMDPEGRAWVTVTQRRRNAEIDIRSHQDWEIASIRMESVEDREKFIREKLAPEKSDSNSWLGDHNGDGIRDWQDLTVHRESVYRIEDLTGSGRANRSVQFFKGFNKEFSDVAGAVLYHQDDVFVGAAPEMWRMSDDDGDGYGENQNPVSTGFGVNIGFSGHGMSGAVTGPDGRIYWSIGDRGASVTDGEGKNWHYPREGVIVRSEPDGSNFEVFARGLRNTHEFVFDQFGNLITVDNDGDHPGEHERILYVINGSDSGWRTNWQYGKYSDPANNDYKVWMEEEYYKPAFDGQAALHLPPVAPFYGGPAGMAYSTGTALNGDWEDHFFVATFRGSAARSGIRAFTLENDGASFRLVEEKEVLEGILATGLDIGPDGALYFADWIEGWELKQRGRIWKIDATGDDERAAREETKSLLTEDFTQHPSEELLQLLGHSDMQVRQKAQFELAGREDTIYFLSALRQGSDRMSRIHGIWGLAQIGRKNPDVVDPLIDYLNDNDSEIRAQAAKMLGEVRYEPAGEHLIRLLRDRSARVQFFALEALGRIAFEPAIPAITAVLEKNDGHDVYLRHGAMIALARIGDAKALTGLADHPSAAVRIAAVGALGRMDHPGVAEFLKDEDEFIVTNTARAINDDRFIEEALPGLAAMLDQRRFLNEPLIRRALNTALFLGEAAGAESIAALAADANVPAELRTEALDVLSIWPGPSLLDRVTGDPRERIRNDAGDAKQALASVLPGLFGDGDDRVRTASLRAAGALDMTAVSEEIASIAAQDPSDIVRVAALETLAKTDADILSSRLVAALEDSSARVRMFAIEFLPDLKIPEEEMVAWLEPVLEKGTAREQQAVLNVLGNMDTETATEILNELVQQLKEDQLAPEIWLELSRAVENRGLESLQEEIRQYHLSASGNDSLARYRVSLYGGSASRGEELFRTHQGAQCIRCHTSAEGGSNVGPELGGIAEDLSRKELLEAMTAPNTRIAPGFGSVHLTMNDGSRVQGILQEETETGLTLSRGKEEVRIRKEDIDERTHSVSGMPAMGDILTKEELRDLVEYLAGLTERNSSD